MNEVKSHITAMATQSHAELRIALNEVRKGWRCDPEIGAVDELLGLPKSPEAFAEAFFDVFADETEPEIVKVEGLVSHDEVIRRYFATEPPFSKKEAKKSEFPDALARLSLEAWATANKTLVLIVSADGDWRKFAEQSECLVVVSELNTTALDHFNVSNEVRKTVGRVLEMLQKVDAVDMHEVDHATPHGCVGGPKGPRDFCSVLPGLQAPARHVRRIAIVRFEWALDRLPVRSDRFRQR